MLGQKWEMPCSSPSTCTLYGTVWEAGGAQMRLWETSRSRAVAATGWEGAALAGGRRDVPVWLPALCPGVFDFCINIHFSAAPLWKRLSAPWQPVVLLLGGASLWRLHKLFASCRDVSSMPCPLQRRQNYSAENHVKEKITKSRENETAKDGKEIAYKYFLISFLSLLPSLLLCPPWLFISG